MKKFSEDEEDTIIRSARLGDLKTALQWANEEGWNPGKYDAESYYNMGVGGFFCAYRGKKMVAFLSAVRYQGKIPFVNIGMFIVKKEFRGKGIGKSLWNHVIKSLSEINRIYLNSVRSQVMRYQLCGFYSIGEISRYTLTKKHTNLNFLVSPSRAHNFIDMCGYDKEIWRGDRKVFFKSTLKHSDSHALLLRNRNSGDVVGYGMSRACEVGYRIGPVYGNSGKKVVKLISALLSYIKTNSLVILDIPKNYPYLSMVKEFFNLIYSDQESIVSMLKSYRDGIARMDNRCAVVGSLEIGGPAYYN